MSIKSLLRPAKWQRISLRYQTTEAVKIPAQQLAHIQPGDTHRSRYVKHYHDTLASDLLYMNYDHAATINPQKPPELPSWDPTNPFSKNRPRPRVSGRMVPQPAKKPTTDKSVTRLESVTINIHVKQAAFNKQQLLPAMLFLRAITGKSAPGRRGPDSDNDQSIKVSETTQKSASFRIRGGQPCGVYVTLKGPDMYDFLETVVEFVMPRLKDWNGVELPPANKNVHDNIGAVSFGLPTQAMGLFPSVEINLENYPRQYGMSIHCVTNARGPGAQGRVQALLSGMRIPFIART